LGSSAKNAFIESSEELGRMKTIEEGSYPQETVILANNGQSRKV
jgi:hypothetical protein